MTTEHVKRILFLSREKEGETKFFFSPKPSFSRKSSDENVLGTLELEADSFFFVHFTYA